MRAQPCPVGTHNDALMFILDSYDTLISPNITHPTNTNISLITIRRNIYRKQFHAEAVRLLHALISLTPSVDDLVQVIHHACASCGLMLL